MSELDTTVIRSDRCLECCERTVKKLNVEIGALLSGLLATLQQSDGTNTIALVPIAFAGAATRGYASVISVPGAAAGAGGAGILASLGPGVVVLGTALEMVNLASQRSSFEMLGLVLSAVQNYFDIRDQPEPLPLGAKVGTKTKTKTRKDCEDCVKRRILSQGAKRHRETAKILRRL